MSATRRQFTLCPDLPRDNKIADKEGEMLDLWQLFFTQLVMALQVTFKPEGFVMPFQTAAQIANLTSIASLANILYNSTSNVFEGNILSPNTPSSPKTQAWYQFAMLAINAGNPNFGGVPLAGTLYLFCYDTVGKLLYICTTPGLAGTAVWTAV